MTLGDMAPCSRYLQPEGRTSLTSRGEICVSSCKNRRSRLAHRTQKTPQQGLPGLFPQWLWNSRFQAAKNIEFLSIWICYGSYIVIYHHIWFQHVPTTADVSTSILMGPIPAIWGPTEGNLHGTGGSHFRIVGMEFFLWLKSFMFAKFFGV